MSSPISYKPGQFCWTEIATRDVEGAKKFFSEFFGWQIQSVPMPGEAGTYHLMQIDGKDVAGLYEMKGEMFEGVPPHMSSYVWTDDTDAAAAKVKELGGTVVAEPFDVPMVGRMAVCQDPTGATFSLFHGDPHPGAAQGDSHGYFCWRECLTKNTDTAGAFYTNLFGYTAQEMDMGEQGMYTMLMMGEMPAAGMMALNPEWGEVPSHWGVYVTVNDVDKDTERAASLGAKVVVPPSDIPNMGRFSMLTDPTGVNFGIFAAS